MARRRMFSLDIVDTDKFTEMPSGSQALYFHLGMRADDDGFVSSPKKIMRSLNFCEDEMKILIAKGFVHIFGTGICVIVDWKMNNYIQKDRYTKTIHNSEFIKLSCDVNGSYVVGNRKDSTSVNKLDTECIQDVYEMDTQVREVEVSPEIVKESNTVPEKSGGREYSEIFERFFVAYGRKGNKAKAFEQWKKLKDSQIEEIRKKIGKYLDSTSGERLQFRKNAETYLNHKNEHWNDEVIEAVQKKPEQEEFYFDLSEKRY